MNNKEVQLECIAIRVIHRPGSFRFFDCEFSFLSLLFIALQWVKYVSFTVCVFIHD